MQVLSRGHTYLLDVLDESPGPASDAEIAVRRCIERYGAMCRDRHPQLETDGALVKALQAMHEMVRHARRLLVFVRRDDSGPSQEGTQTQDVLRVAIDALECLVDRTNHCDACRRWEGNDRIVKALTEAQRQMRLALLYHEQRAMERKVEKGTLQPEKVPVGEDGHFRLR